MVNGKVQKIEGWWNTEEPAKKRNEKRRNTSSSYTSLTLAWINKTAEADFLFKNNHGWRKKNVSLQTGKNIAIQSSENLLTMTFCALPTLLCKSLVITSHPLGSKQPWNLIPITSVEQMLGICKILKLMQSLVSVSSWLPRITDR